MSGCLVATVATLVGLLYVVTPHVSSTVHVTAVGTVVAVLGLPLLGIFVHWWVNESVYDTTGRAHLGDD